MTQKITGQGSRPVDAGSTRRADKADAGQTARPARAQNASSSDTVNVERSELLLARLEQALKAAPAVDAGRVRAIRDAIASGTYEIDAVTIAEKIMRLERELGS